MLGITGGTGGLGSAIVNHIIDKSLIPLSQLVVVTRDTSTDAAKGFASKGVVLRQGNFGEQASLTSAFSGLDSVLIMPPGPSAGPHGTKYQVDAIDAAKSAGVKKIFLISNVAAKPVTDFEPAIIHYDVEQHLEKEGWDFVVIRNAFYMNAIDNLLTGVEQSGSIIAPPDGKVDWIEREDLGQAAAHIITGGYSGKERYIDLVPPQAHDLADAARYLSKILGRTITRQEITSEQFYNGLIAHGVPQPGAFIFTSIPTQAHKGDWTKTGSIVEDLLGRRIKTLEEYLTEKYGQKA